MTVWLSLKLSLTSFANNKRKIRRLKLNRRIYFLEYHK